MLGLKVKKRWLERMRGAKKPFTKTKTIELRRYLPEKYVPKGEELKPGDRFYLLCDGEIWGSATLDGFHLYRTLESFEMDREEHQVTPETTPASGATSYARLTAAFPPLAAPNPCAAPRSPVLYGWCLGGLKFFMERPRAGQPYGDAIINNFMSQRHGQVFFRGSLPLLEEDVQPNDGGSAPLPISYSPSL